MALTYTDSVAGEHTQSRKFEVPVYFEDFDGVELGPNVDELAVALEEAWTPTGPEAVSYTHLTLPPIYSV